MCRWTYLNNKICICVYCLHLVDMQTHNHLSQNKMRQHRLQHNIALETQDHRQAELDTSQLRGHTEDERLCQGYLLLLPLRGKSAAERIKQPMSVGTELESTSSYKNVINGASICHEPLKSLQYCRKGIELLPIAADNQQLTLSLVRFLYTYIHLLFLFVHCLSAHRYVFIIQCSLIHTETITAKSCVFTRILSNVLVNSFYYFITRPKYRQPLLHPTFVRL